MAVDGPECGPSFAKGKNMNLISQSADLLVPALAARFAETVDGVLPAGPLALVDFPDHSNVGDSAI